MRKSAVVLLNGHPGSGKSTISREIAKHVSRLAVLDVDMFRKFVSDYNHSSQDIRIMWTITFTIIEVYLSNHISVLVDRCIEEQRIIAKLKAVARSNKALFREVILYTSSLNCALSRVASRSPKPFSRYKKSKINIKLINDLRDSILKRITAKDIVSFDTETVSMETVAKQISNMFLLRNV